MPKGLAQPHVDGRPCSLGVARVGVTLGVTTVALGRAGIALAVGNPALTDGLTVGAPQAPTSRTTATAAHILCMR